MRKIIPLLLALALSACQSLPSSQDYADVDHLPQTEAAFLKRTKAIQEVAKAQSVKETVYFDKDWNLVENKDPQGYYRESYGLQDNGLYLIQDFYAEGHKQTGLFYGIDIQDPHSERSRGYLSLYNKAGKMVQVMFVFDNERYNLNGFCQEVLCLEEKQIPQKNDKKILKDGKTIETTISTNEESGAYQEQIKRWYANGQTASIVEVSGNESSSDEAQRKEQYFLEDGTASASEPETESYRALKEAVEAVNQAVFGD